MVVDIFLCQVLKKNMEYKECVKIPSKSRYSRKELDKIASENGLNPENYKTKNLLCEALEGKNIIKNNKIDDESSERSKIKKETSPILSSEKIKNFFKKQ